MKKKQYLYLLLVVSVLGLATGVYLKYFKSYTDQEITIQGSDEVIKHPNLGQTIDLIEKLDALAEVHDLSAPSNEETLQKLKIINYAAIGIMAISILIGINAAIRLKVYADQEA